MSASLRPARSCLALATVLLAIPGTAQAFADLDGETVTIQIGHGTGGGHDTHSPPLRMLSQFTMPA